MPENLKEKEGIESGHYTGEPEIKTIKKRIKFGHDVGEPETKEGIESKNDVGEPKTKEGIESGHDAKELETKEGIESGHNAREPETKEGIECVQRRKEWAMPQSKASIPCQKPTTAHKFKVTKLEILQTFMSKENPALLIHNIQYPPTTDRGYAPVCTSETQISR